MGSERVWKLACSVREVGQQRRVSGVHSRSWWVYMLQAGQRVQVPVGHRGPCRRARAKALAPMTFAPNGRRLVLASLHLNTIVSHCVSFDESMLRPTTASADPLCNGQLMSPQNAWLESMPSSSVFKQSATGGTTYAMDKAGYGFRAPGRVL